MAKKVVTFVLRGKRPLLCKSPRSMVRSTAKLGTKRIPTPEEEAEMGTYLDPEKKGRYMFPAIAVRNCMIQAAKSSRLKFGKATAASILSAAVFLVEEFVPILDPKTMKPIKSYEIDVRRAVVQRQGVMRARPKFNSWALRVPLEVNDSLADNLVDASLQILNSAGDIVGIGDFRVHKNGLFGQFDAEIERNGKG